MTPAERRGRYKMGTDVLLVPCTRCGVAVGERCRIGRGHYAHPARYDAIVRAVTSGKIPNAGPDGVPFEHPRREPGPSLTENYRWPKEAGPSARGLTPEQARAEMIAQVEKARDLAVAAEVRAQADAMLDVLRTIPLGGPDLRIVRDDGPETPNQ
jgi:hypothetical protein